MKAILIRAVLCAAVAAGLLAFNHSRQQREPRVAAAAKEKILLAGNGSEIETLDPHLATGVPEHRVMSAMFEGLLASAPDNPDDVVPGAASTWTNEGFKVWTFHLQPAGKWSDGTPVTAHDFVYSYHRILSPDLGADYAEMLYALANAERYHKGQTSDFSRVGVKALDDLTLQLTLVGPMPYLPGMLKHYTWFPVPRHIIEKHGGMTFRDSTWTRPENIVSNGPFRMKEWKFTHLLEVERNPHYWNRLAVKLNGVRFYPIASDTTEERAYQDGQLHVTSTLPLPRIPAYRQSQSAAYHEDAILGSAFYRINITKPPLNNPDVRRALMLTIDRKGLVTKVLKAGQQPATGLTPPGCGVGYTTPSVLKFDPVEARRLLAKAGYPDGKGFPKFDILINSNEAHRTIAEAIQDMWKTHLNIPVSILNQDWAVYLESMRTLDYQICRAGWLGDYPDPMTFLSIWRTGDGNNCTGWSNPTYDRLLNDSSTEPNPAKRLALLRQAEELLLSEMPILPIYWQTHAYLVSPEVKNWKPSVLEQRCYSALDLESQSGN